MFSLASWRFLWSSSSTVSTSMDSSLLSLSLLRGISLIARYFSSSFYWRNRLTTIGSYSYLVCSSSARYYSTSPKTWFIKNNIDSSSINYLLVPIFFLHVGQDLCCWERMYFSMHYLQNLWEQSFTYTASWKISRQMGHVKHSYSF